MKYYIFLTYLLIFISQPLQAYYVTFTDNKLDPGAGKKTLSLYVTNDGDKMLPIEVRPATREQDEMGNEINNETDDIFIVPFQLLLPPFSEQSVSIQWVGDSLVEKEKAYRIIVDPIPVKENEGLEVKSIYTRVVFVKSLYVLPKERVVSLELIDANTIDGFKLEFSSPTMGVLAPESDHDGVISIPYTIYLEKRTGNVATGVIVNETPDLNNQTAVNVIDSYGFQDGNTNVAYNIHLTIDDPNNLLLMAGYYKESISVTYTDY